MKIKLESVNNEKIRSKYLEYKSLQENLASGCFNILLVFIEQLELTLSRAVVILIACSLKDAAQGEGDILRHILEQKGGVTCASFIASEGGSAGPRPTL